MMVPLIIVRDKITGERHIVGSSPHDTLCIDANGRIVYYNLQDGSSTNDDYSFQGITNEMDPVYKYVKMVSVDDVNKICTKRHERKRKFLKEFAEKYGTHIL